MYELGFKGGTVEVRCADVANSAEDSQLSLEPHLQWDVRARCYRAPALHYADVVRFLVRNKLEYTDTARRYEELEGLKEPLPAPRPYQADALTCWLKEKGRGNVVLPTGAGKTIMAMMAMAVKGRSTLVIAPTLDLVRQWYDGLRRAFRDPVGVVGGGEYDLQPLTVTTYDSAYQHMEHFGNRFGMVVFDECHHLPAEGYSLAARMCLAPYRLGLTATPERADGREELLCELVGPFAFRKEIQELAGSYLADYEVVRKVVRLTEEEQAEYQEQRDIYRAFLRSQGIRMGEPGGFGEFLMRASRSDEGRRALLAYRTQRALSLAAEGKQQVLAELLFEHRGDRMLIFTENNSMAYDIATKYLIPVITHQTKFKERSAILSGLESGVYNAVVTSKVLNEGVDVPSANVAVVVSGSGSVREHVQRLGRILRKQKSKQAVLYEIVAEKTAEAYTSKRRRQHNAYR